MTRSPPSSHICTYRKLSVLRMKMEWGAARREEMVRKEHVLMEQRSKEATNSRWGLSFPRGHLSLSPSPHNYPVCPPQREVSFVFTFLRNLPFIPLLSTRFAAQLISLHLFFTTVRVPTHQDVPQNKGRFLLFHLSLARGRCLLWSSMRCGEQTELQVSFRCLSEPHLTHFCRDGARQVCNDRWRQSTPLSGAVLASLPSSWKTKMELGLTPQWGAVGRIPGAQPCPGAVLLDPSSQRDPGDSEEKGAFKSSLYDRCFVKEDLYWTKWLWHTGFQIYRSILGTVRIEEIFSS